MKIFKGSLETAGGDRAPASLAIDEDSLTLKVGESDLGSWGFDTVEVRRSASDRFALELDGERLTFIANDPVDFAYTVPDWIETRKPKSRKGFKRRLEQRRTNLIERIERSGGRRHTRKISRSADHVHDWSEQNLPGGLIRRVCKQCDQVSIDLRGADLPEETVARPDTPSTTG